MTTAHLKAQLQKELTPSLGRGEAASVSRLVMEDLFNYRSGQPIRALSEDEITLAAATLTRLKRGEPVQYITGIADFYGLQLWVTPDVLIPRSETEELVEWILADHPVGKEIKAVDLGTGSGCIPLALKSCRPQWRCVGREISPTALEVAIENRNRLGLEVKFELGDMTKEQLFLPGEQFDVVVSNPPYILPSEQTMMDASTLKHEPTLALFTPQDDPLLYYRHIANIGREVLADRGRLYCETNEFNSDRVVSLLIDRGYQAVERKKDLRGKWRMVRATRPPNPVP